MLKTPSCAIPGYVRVVFCVKEIFAEVQRFAVSSMIFELLFRIPLNSQETTCIRVGTLILKTRISKRLCHCKARQELLHPLPERSNRWNFDRTFFITGETIRQ
jgi:hypothetical protein